MALIGWRLPRGRANSSHVSLAVCGVLALVIVLLGKAESGIFDGVRAKLTDWTAPILEGMREPLAGMQKWVSGIGDIFTVYEENVKLKQEVAELRKWQEVARQQQTRLQRYEILLKAVPDEELPSVQARVIGQSNRPFIKTMILNAGSTQGVKSGQAVIDDRGLIGRIYVTGASTSWVILLGDLNSRVPVTVSPSNRRAMLSGDNSTSPHLELDAGLTSIHSGDRVYSSGDGGLLPPGLPVGVVVEEGGAFQVALFADPDATDFVHVVDYSTPPQPAPSQITQEMPIPPARPAPPPPQVPAPDTTTPARPSPSTAAIYTTPPQLAATAPRPPPNTPSAHPGVTTTATTARPGVTPTTSGTTTHTPRKPPARRPPLPHADPTTPAPMILDHVPEPTTREDSGDEMDQ